MIEFLFSECLLFGHVNAEEHTCGLKEMLEKGQTRTGTLEMMSPVELF